MTSYSQVWGMYDSYSAPVFVMYFVKTLVHPFIVWTLNWKHYFFSFFLFITGILMVMDRFQGQVTLWLAVDINLLTNQDLLSCWVTESLNLEVTCKSGGHKFPPWSGWDYLALVWNFSSLHSWRYPLQCLCPSAFVYVLFITSLVKWCRIG